MKEIIPKKPLHDLRLLVAVTSYGERNLEHLKKVIRGYQELPLQVRIIVFSEAPKNLGPGVEVIVGLPSKNPWSLGFAHKALFAREAENYDLFAYSEDDILITARNLEAFLKVTPHLASNEIVGFMHFERDTAGKIWMVNIGKHFHWVPESVRHRDGYLVAEFTNEHSAFYLLTKTQLKRAIASGGFLRDPYEGKYDMLCAAATDPYTSCGFRKVTCISHLDDFLIHHVPDRYLQWLDVSLSSFKEQIATLFDISRGAHPASTLCDVLPDPDSFEWAKGYYEKPSSELLGMIPNEAKEILSIGCGWGETERQLMERGAAVTAVPLDSVIGAVAASKGVDVIYGTWDECFNKLNGRRFDCVLMTNLLHLQPSPRKALAQCSEVVANRGSLVLTGPNFKRIPWLVKRVAGANGLSRIGRRSLKASDPATLSSRLKRFGFRVTGLQWLDHTILQEYLRGREIPLGRFTAREWLLQAQKHEV
jgi:2-polyprenyl-3-methyl-5-hydroxy-6-metoxy-1,4-benzoquinol methylase